MIGVGWPDGVISFWRLVSTQVFLNDNRAGIVYEDGPPPHAPGQALRLGHRQGQWMV